MHPPVALRAGGMCANTRAREGMHVVVWRGKILYSMGIHLGCVEGKDAFGWGIHLGVWRGKTLSVDSFSIVWEMADPCVCGRGG